MNSDFKDLLAILEKHKVRYLIVGGYAVIHYSQPRFTKDLDIWLEASPDNAPKVLQAFKEFGISTFGLTQSDFEHSGTQLNVGTPPCSIDFLTGLPGVDFAECWERKEESQSEGSTLLYISKADLIRAKEVAGRQVDLADLEELRD